MNQYHSSKVQFSPDDLALFSAASHDRNPLHLSAEYARKTTFGQQVVFGILGAFGCLGRVEPRLNCTLSRVSLEFRHPVFLGIEYEVMTAEHSPGMISAKLCDGSKVLIKADFTLAKNSSIAPTSGALPEAESPLQIPADPDDTEFTEGTIARGKYWPDHTAMAELLHRFGIDEHAFGNLQLSALLWSSYLIGMEQPGLRALFSKLSLAFENTHEYQADRLSYEARVISLNAFGSLRSELQLFSEGRLVAKGESRAFVIPKSRVQSVSELASLVPQSEQLKGKVALVVGASRGLGAMISAALVLQGCTVVVNFNRSESEARSLQANLKEAPGSVDLAKGDAADVSWCEQLEERISRQYGRLDFLICNACPALLPLNIEPKTAERINSYVGNAFALVSVPLSVFSKLLAETSGWSVVISSIAVETSPKEWPHYVAVKCALEGFLRVAAFQYPHANYLLVRPSRLQTDLVNGPSNVPFGTAKAMPPEAAAAKIVERLQGATTGTVEIFRV